MNCKNYHVCNNVAIPGQKTCTVCQLNKKGRWKIKEKMLRDSAELSNADRKYIKNTNVKLISKK